MNKQKFRILVTGVGAIIGYGIIKSLRKLDYDIEIIGMDIYEDAVGQHWCDQFIKATYAVDPTYINFLKKIIDENEIDLVFFGTEQEIYKVNDCREMLEGYLDKMVINKNDVLLLSQDKWKTREFLICKGLEKYTIPSVVLGDFTSISAQFGSPFLLKPRKSYASKGIHQVHEEEVFDFYKKQMGQDFMAQKIIGDADHEYTVGLFGLGDGSYSSSITLKRKLSQEGATAKAETFFDNHLKKAVDNLVFAFEPIGPTNFQFRFDGEGYRLLEINPRISSSTSIRMAFGYNEADMSIAYYLKKEIPTAYVKNGRAVRYIDEVITVL